LGSGTSWFSGVLVFGHFGFLAFCLSGECITLHGRHDRWTSFVISLLLAQAWPSWSFTPGCTSLPWRSSILTRTPRLVGISEEDDAHFQETQRPRTDFTNLHFGRKVFEQILSNFTK
jgi:hypothetical protein